MTAMADSSSDSGHPKPSTSSKPGTADQKVRGKPRKPTKEEDRILVEALRSGKTFERNERQSKELETLKAGT